VKYITDYEFLNGFEKVKEKLLPLIKGRCPKGEGFNL